MRGRMDHRMMEEETLFHTKETQWDKKMERGEEIDDSEWKEEERLEVDF